MQQPTYEELLSALNEYSQVIGITGAESEYHFKLLNLRTKKTTWVGKEENDLRFAIDNALDYKC